MVLSLKSSKHKITNIILRNEHGNSEIRIEIEMNHNCYETYFEIKNDSKVKFKDGSIGELNSFKNIYGIITLEYVLNIDLDKLFENLDKSQILDVMYKAEFERKHCYFPGDIFYDKFSELEVL